MKIHKISWLMVIFFLFGCSSIQPKLIPAFTSISTNKVQSIETAESLRTAIPTIQPKDSESGVRVISKDKETIIVNFDWSVSSLLWSEDGKKLIIYQNKSLYIYNLENKKITTSLIGNSLASPLVLSPGKKILVTTLCNDPDYVIGDFCWTQDYSIYFVNLETGNLIKTFHLIDSADAQSLMGILIFSPDGKLLIANNGVQIILWDIASNQKIKELFKLDQKRGISPQYRISAVSVSPDGKSLIAAYPADYSTKKTFMVWDTTTWELQRTFVGDNLGTDFSLAFSPDGSRFITSDGSGIHDPGIWDFKLGKMLFSLGAQHWLAAVAYDPSGKYFATGGTKNGDMSIVTIYDTNTGKPVHELTDEYFAISTLTFSPDGTKLAAGGGSDKPGKVIIWDLTQP